MNWSNALSKLHAFPRQPSHTVSASQIRSLDFKLRRIRERTFPPGYFGDPAWDILLELYHALRSGEPYSFPTSGIGMHATTSNYLTMFERDGLVERRIDPTDGNREFPILTTAGRALLDAVFEEAARAFNLVNADRIVAHHA